MKHGALLAFLLLALVAGCKKEKEKAPPPRVKKVVRVHLIDTKYIELDDGSLYAMGENMYNRLVSRLKENDHFVVVVDEPLEPTMKMQVKEANAVNLQESDRLKFDFAPFVTADFHADVKELTFAHGSHGAHRFAGFTREFNTPWNNGSVENLNEFPVRSTELSSGWFGSTFAPLSDDGYDTITGVDSGEQGEFNIIIADIHYRRDKFDASASIDTSLDLLIDGDTKYTRIDAKGKGYLFALGASWNKLMLEFDLTRRTAMKDTFDRAVEAITDQIQNDMATVKFRTRIESNGAEGIILNAGRREGMLVGDQFVIYRNGAIASRLKVKETFYVGSVAEVIEGDSNVQVGEIVTIEDEPVKEPIAKPQSGMRSLASLNGASENVTVRSITLDPPELSPPPGEEYAVQKDAFSLPYLLWRWTQYDQGPEDFENHDEENVRQKAESAWNLAQLGVANAWQVTRGHGVKVAVVDSGVDYNHRNLGHAFNRDYVGVDFMSNDPRPFDDNSHGTAIAGIIAAKGIGDEPVGIAPDATLLAYKSFDPWGDTTSAALYGAVDRAIKDDARIIVLAWDTRKASKVMEAIVHLAEANDVLLIAAAGDRGANLRDIPNYPAAYSGSPSLLVVASLAPTGALSRASGRASNYGDGIVDIAAPGENLRVLAPRSEYLTRSGSDLAAAHVAGVAALVKAAHPEMGAKALKESILRGCNQSRQLTGLITNGCALSAVGALGIRH